MATTATGLSLFSSRDAWIIAVGAHGPCLAAPDRTMWPCLESSHATVNSPQILTLLSIEHRCGGATGSSTHPYYVKVSCVGAPGRPHHCRNVEDSGPVGCGATSGLN